MLDALPFNREYTGRRKAIELLGGKAYNILCIIHYIYDI